MRHDYCEGTWIEGERDGRRRARVMCQDGIIRMASAEGVADTFFSIPARVRIRGKSTRGFITRSNGVMGSYLEFIPYTGGKK